MPYLCKVMNPGTQPQGRLYLETISKSAIALDDTCVDYGILNAPIERRRVEARDGRRGLSFYGKT